MCVNDVCDCSCVNVMRMSCMIFIVISKLPISIFIWIILGMLYEQTSGYDYVIVLICSIISDLMIMIGLYCSQHKLDDMIDVISRRCLHPNCYIQPSFNYEGETKSLYCFQHKIDNMIDVKNIRCLNLNCYTRPSFNYIGENIGLYCLEHKIGNMINVYYL